MISVANLNFLLLKKERSSKNEKLLQCVPVGGKLAVSLESVCRPMMQSMAMPSSSRYVKR